MRLILNDSNIAQANSRLKLRTFVRFRKNSSADVREPYFLHGCGPLCGFQSESGCQEAQKRKGSGTVEPCGS
jgi:hypothetical protein